MINRLRTTTGNNYIFGAFDNENLVGCAGFVREERTKLRHKGNVWGMYVIPVFRRKGIGRQLLKEIIVRGNSMEGLELLNLSVLSDNSSAKKLYQSLGFVTYGVEKRAIKLGTSYKDEDLMVLVLAKFVCISDAHRITAYSRNLRKYECSNQTSGIRGTLSEMSLSEKV